jgi:hypothetical protein
MTKFEFFEMGYGLIAARLGLVSPTILAKYDVYKTYLKNLEYCEDDLKEDGHGIISARAKKLTMQECKCGYYMVARAVTYFEEGKVLQISVNG